MKSAAASLLLLLCVAVRTNGAFTDFEDLTGNAVYLVGSSFESKGLLFEVVTFPDMTGVVAVAQYDQFGPLETVAVGGGGLSFELPANTNYISIDYGTGNDPAGMILNGVSTPFLTSFDALDGTTVAGVTISLTTPKSPLWDARLTLTGEIETFIIGGIELGIDNVAVFVPEPATTALMLIGTAGLALKRNYY